MLRLAVEIYGGDERVGFDPNWSLYFRRELMTVSQVIIKLEDRIEREKDLNKTVKCIENNHISRS